MRRVLVAVALGALSWSALVGCSSAPAEPGAGLPPDVRGAAQEELDGYTRIALGGGAVGGWVTARETASVAAPLPAGATGLWAGCSGDGTVTVSWVIGDAPAHAPSASGSASASGTASSAVVPCGAELIETTLTPPAHDERIVITAERPVGAVDTTWWVLFEAPDAE